MGCGQSAQKKPADRAVEGESNPTILAGGPKEEAQPKVDGPPTETLVAAEENKLDVTEASKETQPNTEEPQTEKLPPAAETKPFTENEIEVQPKAEEPQLETLPAGEESKADVTPVGGGEPAGDTKTCDASLEEAKENPEEAKAESKAVDAAEVGTVEAKTELDEANSTAKPVDDAEPESEPKDRAVGVETASADPEGANNKTKVVDGVSDEKQKHVADVKEADVTLIEDAQKNTECRFLGFTC